MQHTTQLSSPSSAAEKDHSVKRLSELPKVTLLSNQRAKVRLRQFGSKASKPAGSLGPTAPQEPVSLSLTGYFEAQELPYT